jgi:helix-turn-helix protein
MSKKDKRVKRLRINHSKSPLSVLKKKTVKKEFKNKDLEMKLKDMEHVIARTQKIIDEFEKDEKRDKLLKMIYQDDIDEDTVKSTMNISDKELNFLIEELISKGFVQFVSSDDIELTSKGILHAKNEEF